MKFIRRCQLSVEVSPNAQGVAQSNLTIPEELTVEFEISRQSLASSQEATFRVFNLSQKTRGLIFKDPYALTEFRAVQFRAGYRDDPVLPLCFNGFMRSAVSYRPSGGTEMITEIKAYDGGLAMANGFTSQTIASGTSVATMLSLLAKQLPRISGSPVIGAFPVTNKRGTVLLGNTWALLLELSGGLATIDNGQVKALNYNEAIAAEIPVINSESGLLGSPQRSSTKIDVEMLFEPRLTLGQVVQLESRDSKLFNGTYKVMGFTHRGTISPAVAGACSSLVSLFFGSSELQIVQANLVQ